MSATYSAYIEAPVEAVFDFWKDPRKQLSVMPVRADVTDVATTAEGVGTYVGWATRLFGVPVKGFDVFTEFVPNRRITDRSSFALAGTWTFTFEREGSGTRFTMQRRPGSPLLRPVDRLLERFRASSSRQTLTRMKAVLERAAAPAAAGHGAR